MAICSLRFILALNARGKMQRDWRPSIRFLVCLMLIFGLLQCSGAPVKKQNKVLLISLDGFRHDYLELAQSAHINISAFERIWLNGFRAMRVDNEFITRTGPNHFSLATGLHEENHGFVDNVFFDPKLNESFNMASSVQSTQSRWFDVGAEPIWVTNQRHGHRSAVTVWPGSLASIRGMLPSERYEKFDASIPLRKSIDWIIDRLEEDNITLGLLYHNEPDAQGHKTGPHSMELLHVIGSLNGDIAHLLQRLDSTPVLRSQLNIILTSDHGMSEVSEQHVIFLDHFINQSMYTSPGPEARVVWSLWPQAGFTVDQLYTKLINAHGKMRVYRREEIPSRFHYSKHWRIAPLLVFAEPGWLIVASNNTSTNWFRRGEHGYDNQWPDMSPFFLAMGPGFRVQPDDRTIPRIKMIDIYPMICHLLGLHKPAPNNGSLDRVLYLLNAAAETSLWFNAVGVVDQLLVSSVLLITLIVAFTFIASGCLTFPCLHRVHTMRSQRRERVKKLQLPQQTSINHSLRMLPLPGAINSNDASRHLLGDNESDEIDLMISNCAAGGLQANRDTDMDWINMLHGPKSRYP